MAATVADNNGAVGFRRNGRPPASVDHKVNANCDVISTLRDDQIELDRLGAMIRSASNACRCANRQLHIAECELRTMLLRKEELVSRRRAANAALTGSAS